MSKIRIVNWLLTRKCNLDCSYCAITKNYKNKPSEYPDISHYYKNEISTEYVIEGLRKFKEHNPDCFHILYGGEPLLRPDLSDIINYCNKENIHYTIITNNSIAIQPMLEKLFAETDYVTGFTGSVDPIIFDKSATGDILNKSLAGLKALTKYKDSIKDLVAEITVSNDNIKYLYDLVSLLSNHGINSDITFIDIAKNPYYDFSNVTDKKSLVHQSKLLEKQFELISKNNLDTHMGSDLNQKIWDILPSNLNCEIEKGVHNLTIDADGSIRLCLRIAGVKSNLVKLHNVFTREGSINPNLMNYMKLDKIDFCELCNWTCMLHSKMVNKDEDRTGSLIHSNKRI
jgi:MoaA/NifB/PqqE/SkfB family radical SAM enzyme